MSETDNYSDIHLNAQRYIEEHYQEQIMLSDFARWSGYSKQRVISAMAYNHTNWPRMLLSVRMTRAKELLRYSGESIDTISTRVGYPNTAMFERTFKAEEGKTPEEYQQWTQNQTT